MKQLIANFVILSLIMSDTLAASFIDGKVIKVSSSKSLVLVNVGRQDGLTIDHKVKLFVKDKKVAKGEVVRLFLRKAVIKISKKKKMSKFKRGMRTQIKIKGNRLMASQMEGSIRAGGNNDGKKNRLKIGIETMSSDNTFKLPTSVMNRIKSQDPDDIASGRYKNMDSISDMILTPSIKYDLFLNEDFSIKMRSRYHHSSENSQASYSDGRISVKRKLGQGRNLQVETNVLLDYFPENYLSSAIDLNGNGNISKNERSYTGASYNQYNMIAKYQHRVLKNGRNKLFVSPFIGGEFRGYNNLFANRNRNVLLSGGSLKYQYSKIFSSKLTYQMEAITTGDAEELVLFNEVNTGKDLNGDGIMTENSAVVSRIDRSRKRHTIGLNIDFQMTKKLALTLGYKVRTTSYETDNAIDVDHYQVTENRQQMESDLSWKMNRSVQIGAGVRSTNDSEFSKTDIMLKGGFTF